MNVRALRYFVQTVRCASFTQAAQALFVTQSTVSKMIRQLEEEVGTPLLIRDGHRARPTDTGRIVFERGQEILAALRQLDTQVQDTAELRRGSLEVGIPPMINLLFTPVVKAFRERYPEVSLALREDTGPAVERLVAAGDLEVGATVLPVDPGLGLVARPFGSYPMWAVGAPQAPWNGQATLSLAALHDVPLVMLTEDFALMRRLHRAFADANVEPRIVARSTSWDFLVAMASADLGTTLLPEPLVRRLKTRGLSLARLVKPAVSWEVGHIHAGGRYLSHAARAWLAVCQDVLGSPQGG